jgi:nucleotide-binding universal stress UspA family protein
MTGGVIVVGVDGSAASRDAVHWALGQAVLTGSSVRAVSSWRWPNYVTRIPPGVDLAADTTQTLDETVDGAVAEVSGAAELEISRRVIEGPPGPALLTQAEGAQLLVVGAHGRAAFPVAEYCVRHGHCPVVVVRA